MILEEPGIKLTIFTISGRPALPTEPQLPPKTKFLQILIMIKAAKRLSAPTYDGYFSCLFAEKLKKPQMDKLNARISELMICLFA